MNNNDERNFEEEAAVRAEAEREAREERGPECAWIYIDDHRCGRPADGDDGLCTYHDQEQFEERGE